ncbi:MAG: heme exporter protein CcmB [Alphaproteobacteria bacterium]|nr:heme exporter protein CcmB [Alphaproteobacteria bacterium]
MIKQLLKHEINLILYHGHDIGLVLLFFLLSTFIFPFTLSTDQLGSLNSSGGFIWCMVLFSMLLSFGRLFIFDYHSGELEQYALLPISFEWVVFIKIFCHWFSVGLPLILLSPLIAFFLHMPIDGVQILLLTLLLGTPTLSLLGSFGAALVLDTRSSNLLLFLILLPFYIPVLIFSVSAVDAALTHHSPWSHIALLIALLCIALAIIPFATTIALRDSLE